MIGAIAFPGAAVTAVNNDKITSFGTLRGRIGIASGRALYYVTGGGAFWTWSSTLTVTGLGTASLSNFQGGGAIGGGVEFAINPDWTVKAEYRWSTLPEGEYSCVNKKLEERGESIQFLG